MSVTVAVCNESRRKGVFRRDALSRVAERVCRGEGLSGEIEVSLLLCDDPRIHELNRRYRKVNAATDVLSFEQDPMPGGHSTALGDIVISLETVERECAGNRALMREELSLLFCHGLLHLLGYDHANARERQVMAGKQAQYLGLPPDAAWQFGPRAAAAMSAVPQGARSRG